MSVNVFKIVLISIALLFTAFFVFTIIPPLIDNFDVLGAIGAGYVNPYASGYSTDVILCWFLLAAWVIFEAQNKEVRHGWICLVIGLVPGVAVGFATYLLLRLRYIDNATSRGS